ncbi:efflux RND transporter periplasmic adaptor subunit [Marimonas lutisalis]|uniref:efflux RND transporter periplasmic adaptor subunit n=1 Tax=Marimonas lutisalis TaxID=2545756 RepID=UPI0010F45F6D|nr:HlyD family efflux transporter periplasmic adaptor subunit [Marimonas lutisalis]
MRASITFLARALAFAIPVALGVIGVAYSDNLKTAPATKERARPVTPVRVITLAPIEIVPRVTGYGAVSPAREWRAVARIEGEVIEAMPGLASGALAEAGTLLARIDDSDLQLDLAQVDAQLAALDVRDDTIEASKAIAASDVALTRAELERQAALVEQGVTTPARLDEVRRQELAARAKLTDIDNQLALNAAEREVLKAQRASIERALGFAEIRAPYDIRINEVSAETGQYVTRGQTLVTAEGTEAVEIDAQFPVGRIGPVIRAMPGEITVTDFKARVRLPAMGHDTTWEAVVERVGDAIDARTQSGVIVVRVDDPLGQAKAGERPPLRRNMFVEVTLAGPRQTVLAAPLAAVESGRALVVGAESTLERRAVQVAYAIGDVAVIADGLAEGDKLVLTDPAVAVPGMAVKPVEDKAAMAALAAEAAGKSGGGQGKGGSKP